MSNSINPKKVSKKYDYLIVGTGIGGATFGFKMAQAGYSVLFLEKGRHATIINQFPEQSSEFKSNPTEALKNSGRASEQIIDQSTGKSVAFTPFIGSGVGGSSKLYGMVFERFADSDFDTASSSWCLSPKLMNHYYSQAEKLYRVRSQNTQSKANLEIEDSLAEKKIKTYSLARAQSYFRCKGCQGFVCTCQAKMDSEKACLNQAISVYHAELLTDCEVVRIEANAVNVTGLVVNFKNQELRLTAQNYVLAGGALATPALLLKSKNEYWPNGLANSSDQVGRNLMRHLIDIYGLYTKNKPESHLDLKEFGARDFYTDPFEKRGKGLIQSFGRLPHESVIINEIQEKIQNRFVKAIFQIFAPALAFVLRKMNQRLTFVATILEDSPSSENRVTLNSQGKINIAYRVSSEDAKNLVSFRKNLKFIFADFFQFKLLQAHENDRIAHACGTCRMGKDRHTSVVHTDGHTHDIENLLIVDASVFPTSSSANPSLTIAANALRVADLCCQKHQKKEQSNLNQEI